MAGAIYLIYGRDWDDPAEYDRVFDTGAQTFEEVIGEIKEGLLKKEEKYTEGARRALWLRVLAAKVKAAITTNPKFSISVLDVEPKEEGMTEQGLVVRGVVHNQGDISEIEETAKKLAGEVAVECVLKYRWYPRSRTWKFR
jgi:hypothetical protein